MKVSVIRHLAVLLALSAVTSTRAAEMTTQLDTSGTITIHNASVPLPDALSEGGQAVLKRSGATEGPGAPMPLPSDITDIKEIRKVYNNNLQPYVDHMKSVFPVDIEETTINGISAAIITPKGGVSEKNANRLILNGPGGGFRTGVRANGLLISIPVAAQMKVKVISILYRQGPEHRFPAASEDLLKVWDVVSKEVPPENIGMVGCSAGGMLVSQTTAMLIDAGRAVPGALGVYCAGLGMTPSGDSVFTGKLSITNIEADMKPVTAPAPRGGMSYFDGVDTTQFIAAPLNDATKLAQFPPVLFFTGTRDFLMSGAAYSHRKLLAAGVESDLLIYDGLYHGFMTNPDFPESQEGYGIAADFFDKHLGQ